MLRRSASACGHYTGQCTCNDIGNTGNAHTHCIAPRDILHAFNEASVNNTYQRTGNDTGNSNNSGYTLSDIVESLNEATED